VVKWNKFPDVEPERGKIVLCINCNAKYPTPEIGIYIGHRDWRNLSKDEGQTWCVSYWTDIDILPDDLYEYLLLCEEVNGQDRDTDTP